METERKVAGSGGPVGGADVSKIANFGVKITVFRAKTCVFTVFSRLEHQSVVSTVFWLVFSSFYLIFSCILARCFVFCDIWNVWGGGWLPLGGIRHYELLTFRLNTGAFAIEILRMTLLSRNGQRNRSPWILDHPNGSSSLDCFPLRIPVCQLFHVSRSVRMGLYYRSMAVRMVLLGGQIPLQNGA